MDLRFKIKIIFFTCILIQNPFCLLINYMIKLESLFFNSFLVWINNIIVLLTICHYIFFLSLFDSGMNVHKNFLKIEYEYKKLENTLVKCQFFFALSITFTILFLTIFFLFPSKRRINDVDLAKFKTLTSQNVTDLCGSSMQMRWTKKKVSFLSIAIMIIFSIKYFIKKKKRNATFIPLFSKIYFHKIFSKIISIVFSLLIHLWNRLQKE